MSTYPSPPRTSSPQATRFESTHHPSDYRAHAAGMERRGPYDEERAPPQQRDGGARSARESYWREADLTPLSPKPWDLTFKPAIGPSSPLLPDPDPRMPRPESPLLKMDSTVSRDAASSTLPSYRERKRRSSSSRSPKPLHFSPRYPPPSPYSATRPQPRPGFLRRLRARIHHLSSDILRWIRRHPIASAFLGFIPLMLAGKVIKGLKALTRVVRNTVRGRKLVKSKGIKWSNIFDDFTGFAGSKGGPLNGLLMILRMAVDHYCRLTHSAIPRTASVLLHLYFLEPVHKKH